MIPSRTFFTTSDAASFPPNPNAKPPARASIATAPVNRICTNCGAKQVLTYSRGLIKNIRPIRPGYGLHTKYYDDVIGKIARCDIERGEPLKWNMIE